MTKRGHGIRWKRVKVRDVGTRTLYVDSKTARVYFNSSKGRKYVRMHRDKRGHASYFIARLHNASRVWGGKYPSEAQVLKKGRPFVAWR